MRDNSNRQYTKGELEEIQRDVQYTWASRARNRRCVHQNLKCWHLQLKSGQTIPWHYGDSHCIVKDLIPLERNLESYWVVTPTGQKLHASAYLLLLHIPFYSHHHEHTTGVTVNGRQIP